MPLEASHFGDVAHPTTLAPIKNNANLIISLSVWRQWNGTSGRELISLYYLGTRGLYTYE
jgi:hypothetical protein